VLFVLISMEFLLLFFNLLFLIKLFKKMNKSLSVFFIYTYRHKSLITKYYLRVNASLFIIYSLIILSISVNIVEFLKV